MTRAFLWFVMVATLGGCAASVDAECPAAQVGAFVSGEEERGAPFVADSGRGWMAPVAVEPGQRIDSVAMALSNAEGVNLSLVMQEEAKPMLALYGVQGVEGAHSLTFDAGVTIGSAEYFLLVTAESETTIERADVRCSCPGEVAL